MSDALTRCRPKSPCTSVPKVKVNGTTYHRGPQNVDYEVPLEYLGKVPGMAARRRAVKAHTEACAKMAGV